MQSNHQNRKFREVQVGQLKFNPFELIRGQGFLITAGDREKANSMMANWGFMGYLWNRNVVQLVVRPQRYTKQFLESHDRFSLSFFDKAWHQKMLYFGAHSGRDVDKYAETGLHLAYLDDGTPYIEESQFVLVCRKLYQDEFRPYHFLHTIQPEDYYENNDFHTRYIAELELVLQQISADDDDDDSKD